MKKTMMNLLSAALLLSNMTVPSFCFSPSTSTSALETVVRFNSDCRTIVDKNCVQEVLSKSRLYMKPKSRFQQQLDELRSKMGLPEDIVEAASDPEKFASMKDRNEQKKKVEEERQEKKKKKPFVPIEEWDRLEKEKAKGKGISWEDRVRYEGLRYGDKVKQHDILLRNLNK